VDLGLVVLKMIALHMNQRMPKISEVPSKLLKLASAFARYLASFYGRSEYVVVLEIVVSELKFSRRRFFC
jgi:hypothetical protein